MTTFLEADTETDQHRVSQLATLINGFPFDSADFSSDADVPLLRIRDLTAREFETFVPREAVPASAFVQDGDVVIGMDGDFNSALWSRGEAALNQRVCLLRARGRVDPRYLAYAIPPHLQRINELTWSTTVKHLSAGSVRAIRVPAHSYEQQRAIAGYLDRETAQIDAFIAKNEELIALLTERRASSIVELIGAHETIPLKRLVSPQRPLTYGILQCGEPVESGIPYIGPSDLLGEGASPQLSSLRKTTPEIAAAYGRSVLRGGDIVVSIGPAFGRVGLLSEDLEGANLTQDTVRVATVPELVDSQYLVWVLSSRIADDFWDYEILGATFRRLNLGTLGETPIPYPLVAKQKRIADRIAVAVAEIDRAIEVARRSVGLARERRAALISAAVTGKIDVGVAA
ncbi:restriction endonuclease subunit S [Agromyces aureus]|uniref:Type I restriction modification DNA specificity domain-containing protein n=1 Tax=Agromyces aureus TaxID=453304 RepID=A0A191WIL2_9MICO|nr:restriction endonuclease subunit S [Agromyces aureus]ANJ28096.1 hypothetical protein ATC03_16640 [Agromyces aureus]